LRNPVVDLAMLFDIGWPELLLIGVVALVVIGPKDLPRALRIAGFWVRKARTLSREFQSSVDQMIREAELDDMRQDLKKISDFDLHSEFHKTIDPDGSLAEGLKPPELTDYSPPRPSSAPPPPVERIEAPAEGRPEGAPQGIVPFEQKIETPEAGRPEGAPQRITSFEP
jgi:sec-independent protein translocase protein TatB